MKISKLFTKLIAATAMSMLLLPSIVSASTIKTPVMTGVTKEYSNMVTKANNFDSSLGSLIADGFTKACYTEAALDSAIANANNAIEQFKRIYYINQNGNLVSSGSTFTYLTDPGFFDTIDSYLAGASLKDAIKFDFQKQTVTPPSNTTYPYYGYYGYYPFYDTLWLSYNHALYTANDNYYLVRSGTIYPVSRAAAPSRVGGYYSIIDLLDDYVSLLNAVKAYDRAAGCYSATPITPSVGNAVINAKDKKIYVGDKLNVMKGVTAVDGNGADITNKVTVSGKVDANKAGKYTLTYSVVGANGVTVNKAVTITVRK